MKMSEEKVVLISVVGMSPAILTETIWALHQERPDLLPDEVKVYTTQTAWENLQKIMVENKNGISVWKELQEKVGKKMMLTKHIFHDANGADLRDIVTSDEQKLVADQLLRGIREYKNPQQEVCRVVGSIAGGRKSMSALMYAAMSLGADADDIITHVLADEKASNCREFFFPEQSEQKLTAIINKKTVKFEAKDTQIDLAEIPFVPLATLVNDTNFGTGGTFAKLVHRARNTVSKMNPEQIKIKLCSSNYWVEINGEKITLKPDCYLLLAIMAMHVINCNNKKESISPLTFELAFGYLRYLKKEKILPAQLLQKMETDQKDGKQSIYNVKEWEQSTCIPNLSKIKHNLKEALKENHSVVVNDIFRHGSFGFQHITKIKFAK